MYSNNACMYIVEVVLAFVEYYVHRVSKYTSSAACRHLQIVHGDGWLVEKPFKLLTKGIKFCTSKHPIPYSVIIGRGKIGCHSPMFYLGLPILSLPRYIFNRRLL